ncbi:hypothetical protein HAX54_026283 [Datura stramonium]|uniref:Uncharacterized protein n=1 Tax=Datura stramonium TaxID=4076 RepID=A0ABS8V3Y4_DATST|nr:hypothetical protein [Datura stramonium]
MDLISILCLNQERVPRCRYIGSRKEQPHHIVSGTPKGILGDSKEGGLLAFHVGSEQRQSGDYREGFKPHLCFGRLSECRPSAGDASVICFTYLIGSS